VFRKRMSHRKSGKAAHPVWLKMKNSLKTG
jgi:hypothetical protein